jgi:hypothetical protein
MGIIVFEQMFEVKWWCCARASARCSRPFGEVCGGRLGTSVDTERSVSGTSIDTGGGGSRSPSRAVERGQEVARSRGSGIGRPAGPGRAGGWRAGVAGRGAVAFGTTGWGAAPRQHDRGPVLDVVAVGVAGRGVRRGRLVRAGRAAGGGVGRRRGGGVGAGQSGSGAASGRGSGGGRLSAAGRPGPGGGGRGAAHRERAVPVLLPGPGGAVAGVGGALAGAWRSAEGPVERPAGFVEQVGPGAAREAG